MHKRRAYLYAVLSVLCACHPSGSKFPWAEPPSAAAADAHTQVRTLNKRYSREHSHVLIREIDEPTRAALDYAAYHANFMIAGEAPEDPPAAAVVDTHAPFAELIERASLSADLSSLPLTASERGRPLAFAPLTEYLLAHHVAGAEALEELGSAVRSESWGGSGSAGVPSQSISELYLHHGGGEPELWVKVELAPWFKALGTLPDPDHDGYPEVYGRARADRMNAELAATIESDYGSRILNAAEVRTWANELASYWYPSFNTDLVPAGASWPDAHTEPEIKRELAGLSVASPSIVMRGKPQGQPTYAVFVVKALATTETQRDIGEALSLQKSAATPDPKPAASVAQSELEQAGAASWQAWSDQCAPYAKVVQKRLKSAPAAIKGIPGTDDFLFFRTALESSLSGDLEKQAAGKNPTPVIVEWQRELQRLGVDFLFVPVPAKEEIFPDKIDATLAPLVGKVVNPWQRKLIVDLADQGVETLDLLAPLLAARAQASDSEEPLYQRQDTHWSARGLQLAAQLIAARIKRYPWYRQLAEHQQTFTTNDVSFTRFGDLHSRLAEPQKKHYRPETLHARQVLKSDGSLYEDDPDSPIVVLGDSFTGVYELTDAEHAGLSAHIAHELGYPVDLVMSYGGGPNVRHKLLRRGEEALRQKQLVVWVMADRDLFNYWEDWEPLKKP